MEVDLKERINPSEVNHSNMTEVAQTIGMGQQAKLPVKLSWTDLTYEVYNPKLKTTKTVLNKCTGFAAPGLTTYIMGASGAGKTSLLNALSDRVKIGKHSKITGEILINQTVKMESRLFGKIASYIMQDDYIFEYFTVRESLLFSARLKLCKNSEEEIERIVDDTLATLNISKIANTIVGSSEKCNIAKSQRKMVAIAIELVTNPSLIFLDEPTSGLDSTMALQVSKLLRRLAYDYNKTIVATIH